MGNQRTVLAYEAYARTYAERTGAPSGINKEALDLLAARVGRGAAVLEVGSGPGWDADYLESRGVTVRRTDVTRAFIEVQAERGKRVEPLDLMRDPLGGPYRGLVALCVLQHIELGHFDAVLQRIAASLEAGGALLFSVPEGRGERQEGTSKDYYVALWTADTLRPRLAAVGLEIDWIGRAVEREGPWLTFLATRS